MPLKPKVHNPLPPALQARLAIQREAERKRRQATYAKSPERLASSALINSPRWRRFSKWFLRQPGNALCVKCKETGNITPATETDHIKPRDTHPELTWESSNLQPLCKSHHASKTRREKPTPL